MASIDQDGELYPRGPAELEERVDRGADRPARVEDVVDDDDRSPLDRERNARRAHHRLALGSPAAAPNMHVVAMEGDVERAERQLDLGPLGDEPPQARRERHAARLDADERESLEPSQFVVGDAFPMGSPFDDLVGDAGERLRDRLCVEQNGRGRAFGDVRRHLAPFRPHWTGLKGRG